MVATVPSCETILLFWGLVALVGGGWWRDSGCDGGHDGARDGSGARVSGGLCHRLWAGGGKGESESPGERAAATILPHGPIRRGRRFPHVLVNKCPPWCGRHEP